MRKRRDADQSSGMPAGAGPQQLRHVIVRREHQRHVNGEHIEAHHIGEVHICGRKNRCNVIDHLVELTAHVAWAHDLSVRIDCDLTGCINGSRSIRHLVGVNKAVLFLPCPRINDLSLHIISPMLRTIIFTILIAALAGPSASHHSPVQFNLDVTDFEVSGTIEYLDFRNPHSVIELSVADGDGATNLWYVEFSSVNLLLRRGWDLEQISVGDTVTCIGNPSRNDDPEMYMWTIRLADGTEFSR